MNPIEDAKATRDEVVLETQPDVDLFADSMDEFIASLVWEEADPGHQGRRDHG